MPVVRLLGNSRIRQLANCQLADWTTRGCHRRLCLHSFRPFGGICETASCLVRELAIRELAYPRVIQLPVVLGGHGSTDCYQYTNHSGLHSTGSRRIYFAPGLLPGYGDRAFPLSNRVFASEPLQLSCLVFSGPIFEPNVSLLVKNANEHILPCI